MWLKFNIYKTKTKNRLLELWYKSMKPLATIIMKIEDKIHFHNEEKTNNIVSLITQEDAIKRLLNVMIKEYSKYPRTEWGIFIAERADSDCCTPTIKSYMTDQRYDKYLRSWAYKLPSCSFETNESLTYKFIDIVKQHGAFKVEKVEHHVYGQKYEGTFVISFTDEYSKLFKTR